MNYGVKFKEFREKSKLSQQDMADILKLKRSTYSHYENENQTIPINHLIAFSEYSKISINYLFSLTDKEHFNKFRNVNNALAGERLKEFRKEIGITQNKLASFLNTTQAVIANYERGRNLIATPFLYAICKKYNISADYLLGRVDEPKYLNKN